MSHKNRRSLTWILVCLAGSSIPNWLLPSPYASASLRSTNNLPAIFSLDSYYAPPPPPSLSVDPTYPSAAHILPTWILHHGGAIAPFHPLGSYEPVPKTCKLVQINQLQRHGSRYPTPKVDQSIQRAIRKLKGAVDLDESLAFMKQYRYRLGQSLLIPLGAAESFQAGLDFGSRYRSLIDPQRLPFIRASLSPRVVDSATNFTHGLFSSLGYDHPKKKIEPIDPLLISEDPQSNNTLDDNSCPNRIPSIEKLVWLKIFASPVTEDLNRLAPESNLDNEDTLALMQLCIFESLADSKLSPFCNLFKRDDWLAFGFYYDLDKYYGHGIPNDLARLEGFGYVSELLSRLEGDRKWVEQDRTKVNQTLDRSATTFPLNRSCYIDFSHDNQMVSIFAALGLQKNQTMSESGPARPNPSWNASDWMPFGSRLTIEKLACEEDAQEYVRFLMNDQSIRIPNPDLPFHHHLIPTGPESHPQYLYRLDKLVEFYGRALNHSRDLYHQCSL